MTLFLLLLDASLLVWLAWRCYTIQPSLLNKYYWPSLILKVVAGIGVGLLYFFHYGFGDTLSYWQDGLRIATAIRSTPGEAVVFFWDETASPAILGTLQEQSPRSLFFAKVCGLLALATSGNYWMMATVLSVVSFAAAWFLFRRLASLFPSMVVAGAIAFLLLPSIVFWSSGLIKESLGLAALYVLIAVGLSFVYGQRPSWMEGLLVIVSLWIGWNLKYYWIGIFIPVAVPTLVVAVARRWNSSLKRFEVGLWLLLLAFSLIVATNTHPNFYMSRFLEVICQNNLEFTRLSDPPRIAQYLNLEPSVTSLIVNAPAALIAGLFRPFIWEAFNALSLLAGIENLLLFLLVLQALPAMGKIFSSEHRLPALASVVYVIVLTTFLALSTPNFGTLSRYRIAAVPVLVFLCLGSDTILGRRLTRKRLGDR